MRLLEFKQAPGQFTFTNASSGSGPFYTEITSDGEGSFFNSFSCGATTRTITITAFDKGKQTIAGTFSGTVCTSGSGSRTIQVTKGQFNLPFMTIP